MPGTRRRLMFTEARLFTRRGWYRLVLQHLGLGADLVDNVHEGLGLAFRAPGT